MALIARFLEVAEQRADETALRWRRDDAWVAMTWSEYRHQVARAAAYLTAKGIGPGDYVVLQLRNRPEFHILDFAALAIGAIPISIYATAGEADVRHILENAGAKLVVGEAIGDAEAPILGSLGVDSVSLEEATDGSMGKLAEMLHGVDGIDLSSCEGLRPGGTATIIYTSGTTGPPKGVVLSQENVAWTLESLLQVYPAGLEGSRMVSYLPMAHIAERNTTHYLPLWLGAEVTICPEPAELFQYLQEVHPDFMFGVPRIWEKLAGAIEGGASVAEVGLDKCRVAMTGAAPADVGMIEALNAVGVPLGQIYGLSENTGPMTYDHAHSHPDTVGGPIPGCEVRLDTDGEVLCRGGNVFAGYLNRPEETAATFTADGWMRTGDIGELTDEGLLKIVDRKKDLIITAGGENVSPGNIESRLRSCPLIDQACVIGDRQRFVAALITLDRTEADRRFGRDGGAVPVTDPDLREEIDRHVEQVNAVLSPLHRVKRYLVVPDAWSPATGELTPTLKIKRRPILTKYADQIERLYSVDGPTGAATG